MTPARPARPSHAGHRFPAEAIGHAVWPHFRFPLGPRRVDEPPAARGITVGRQTARRWGLECGRAFANRIRRGPPRAGDQWHPDEVAARIAGEEHRLRRAVDRDAMALDILVRNRVRNRRDEAAAERPPRKPLKKRRRPPRVMITDEPPRHGAAGREIVPGVEHRGHKGLNDRAENSHRPTRGRERRMERYEPARHARRPLPAHDRIDDPFHLRRHRLAAARYRAARTRAFQAWAEITGIDRVA